MTTLNYRIIKDALIDDNEKVDAMAVKNHWIPIRKNQKIETIISYDYRCIVVNGTYYEFHRAIHEVGRPHLLNEILELIKVINKSNK